MFSNNCCVGYLSFKTTVLGGMYGLLEGFYVLRVLTYEWIVQKTSMRTLSFIILLCLETSFVLVCLRFLLCKDAAERF